MSKMETPQGKSIIESSMKDFKDSRMQQIRNERSAILQEDPERKFELTPKQQVDFEIKKHLEELLAGSGFPVYPEARVEGSPAAQWTTSSAKPS